MFRVMRTTSYVVDRQIDEAVGLKRCESHEIMDVDELIRVIRMTELHMNMSDLDDKTCRSRPIV